MDKSQMLGVGVLVLFLTDLWVFADDLGSPDKSWWNNDVQVKTNNNPKTWQRIFKKYCDSAPIMDCDPGTYRERTGPHKGKCVPCNCNGLSHECDPHSGKCLNCQFNTAGDHCERCMEGYYGSAALRTCYMCPCPFTEPSNSFAVGCLRVGDEFECLCKPGYTGVRCERCALGYYGNPLAEAGSCQPCDCNNGYICDPLTGGCYEADDPDIGDCIECDICVKTLLDDLEDMDAELSNLKTQLESHSQTAGSLTALKKLEDAIAATKELVSRYNHSVLILVQRIQELEADIESVKDDLTTLNDKAIQASCTAAQLLKTLDKTYQWGDNVRSESVNLLRKIHEFLEQLKRSNHTGGNTEEATRMLKEARRMLEEMRRQNCRAQRELAKEELRKAQTLLNLIMKDLVFPLNGTLVMADRIGQDLMNRIADLKDIEKALKDAELDVIKANGVNKENEANLEDILRLLKLLEKERGKIMADVNMTTGTLKDTLYIQKMMENLTKEMTHLAAQIDGALTSLNEKLIELSKALDKEGIVRQAEEHAEDLMNQAMEFQMAILNVINSTIVQRAIEAINAYTNLTNAIREAEAAANKAKEAADRALKDVQGQDLQKKAKDLKDHANTLLNQANAAEKTLQDVTQKCEAYKDLIQQAEDKHSQLRQDMRDVLGELNNIRRDDIGALINQTKEAASDVNATASDAIAKLQNISDDLNKTRIPSHDSNLNNILDDINKTLTELDDTFPSLSDKLKEVENQSEHISFPTNMSSSIQRIKDMIEKTRDLANRIKVPIFFSGDTRIELRPPKDLEDLRSFTVLNLTLHRPIEPTRGDGRRRRQTEGDNLFVLYLGNKNTIKDYIGLVVRNGVLFCVYKLGGIVHEIETTEITKSSNNNSFMDRVDFRRVYQDAQVLYTRHFTSSEPKQLPLIINQAKTTVGLLDLDPNEVVIYVGGYPSNFTPPEELRYPAYKGCIEFSTLNDYILGLFNFQHAVGINKKSMCARGQVSTSGNYFDGTGYGKVEIELRNAYIKFDVLSHQLNAVLFYMGDENSFNYVFLEGGYIVLQGAKHDKTFFSERTKVKVFPQTNYVQIRMILNNENTTIQITESGINIYLGNVKGLYKDAYIGGVPISVREKYNIVPPSLRGCVQKVQVDISVSFKEAVGIVPGCLNALLGVREATFEVGNSLFVSPGVKETDTGTMVSVGFKTSNDNGNILETGETKNGFVLGLADGYVQMRDNVSTLRSKHKYETGKWHYITAFKNSTGMQLNVDNTNMGDPQLLSTPYMPSTDFNLGYNNFEGCLRNVYMRSLQSDYIPADLSSFNQRGTVSLGFCKTERPPLDITKKRARHAGIASNINSGYTKQVCRNPRSLKQTYHIGPKSQLQFKIDPEVLANRPQFSLDVRTKSSEGILLHVMGRRAVPLVILYLANGKVKLSIGAEKMTSSQKINDGDWHNIKFSLKKNIFHLDVDGVQTSDGQLSKDKGFFLDLQSIYFGYGPQTLHKIQGKTPSQKSVIGCIRKLKFSDVLLEEPAVNHGATPCFKGMTEKGAYFAGNGAHIALENYLISGSTFNLAFEFRPRNLTGLLFHKRDHHGRTLSVFLKKGKVVVKGNDGRHHYGTSVTIVRHICTEFHYLEVSVRRKTIELRVDEETLRAKGPTMSHPSARETIYFGGISENNHEVQMSYSGCLRNIRLNKVPLSFEVMTNVFGPVNTNECPAE